jgi:hypothetical protein
MAVMTETAAHPTATTHVPFFITPPGETDVLMVVLSVFLFFTVLGFGVFYFRLHSLPEHIAHKSQKIQAELVALLCLISLFTHMHIFWIIGLVLAFIEFPDFGGSLNRIAGSAEKMAGLKPGEGLVELPSPAVAHGAHAEEAEETPHASEPAPKPGDGAIPLPTRTDAAPKHRERIHA